MIPVTERSKLGFLKINGELLRKDGVERTFDDVVLEPVYQWTRGTKKENFKI